MVNGKAEVQQAPSSPYHVGNMVVSLNRGPQYRPYYNPYYGDPQKGTPNFGKPPYRDNGQGNGDYHIIIEVIKGLYRGYIPCFDVLGSFTPL